MTAKEINELYDLLGDIKVTEDEHDDEIVAFKRSDLKKASCVAVELITSIHPAQKMIRHEINEAVAALLAILIEDGKEDDFYDLCHKKLSKKTDKDEVLKILKEIVEALEEDDE